MRLVDANVLLYAVDSTARHHEPSRRWLDTALDGGDVVGFTWIVAVAFVRLSTLAAVMRRPLPIEDAIEQLAAWTSSPHALWPQETHGHLPRLGRLLGAIGVGGNLVNDAHLAAIALEHRASIVSYDNDFGRFENVRWATPSELLAG